jgi:hypothetical protein
MQYGEEHECSLGLLCSQQRPIGLHLELVQYSPDSQAQFSKICFYVIFPSTPNSFKVSD